MKCTFEERNIPKTHRWSFSKKAKLWYTKDFMKVVELEDQAKFTPYLKEELRRYHQSLEDSRAAAADITIPAPSGLEYRPFQKAGIAYCNNRNATLLADDMGLGKTIQTIGLINLHPEFKHVLIVCPASLMLNWVQELGTWLVRENWAIQCVGAVKNGWGSPIAKLKIVVCNYRGLCKLPRKVRWDLIAIDEAQNIKNPDSIRAKRVHALDAPYKLALTGTPFENRPKEIWSILHWLDPETYKEFETFGFRYCDPYRKQMGPVVRWIFDGSSNMHELSTKLRSSLMIRRSKDEVLSELPDKTRQLVELGVGKDKVSAFIDKCRSIMSKRTSSFESDIYDLEEEEKVIFSKVSTQLLEDGLVKVPLVVAHAKEFLKSGKKLVIAAVHREVISQLYEALRDYSPAVITGSTPVFMRDQEVKRFQSDPDCKVFIGQIKSAGVGLTLTAADTMFIAELDWNPKVMAQMEDRIYRMGQKNACLIQYLVLSRSLDAIIAKVMVKKNRVFEEGLDWIQEIAS